MDPRPASSPVRFTQVTPWFFDRETRFPSSTAWQGAGSYAFTPLDLTGLLPGPGAVGSAGSLPKSPWKLAAPSPVTSPPGDCTLVQLSPRSTVSRTEEPPTSRRLVLMLSRRNGK